MKTQITIARARPAERNDAWAIVDEYSNEIGVVLRDSAETFDGYFEDGSGIWIARAGSAIAGCIALRPLAQIGGACEIKRMYVRPRYRGQRIAEKLLAALEAYARGHGYAWAYLDTKDDLLVAIRFYERHGYARIARYNDNPQATIFMRRALSAAG